MFAPNIHSCQTSCNFYINFYTCFKPDNRVNHTEYQNVSHNGRNKKCKCTREQPTNTIVVTKNSSRTSPAKWSPTRNVLQSHTERAVKLPHEQTHREFPWKLRYLRAV